MTDFLFLTHNNVNPYFNLASEEYLLKQTSGFYFYLWINEPAVIVGINQNSIQEVNLSYTDENNIKVVNLNSPDKALLMDYTGDVLETSMNDIEIDIVLDYYHRNKKYMEVQYA